VGQELHLLAQPISMQLFYGGHDPGVKRAASVLEEGAVRHVVGERVLERVLDVRENASLVEELGHLEVGEHAAQHVLLLLGDRLQEGERHILADYRRGLEHALVSGREPIDARGEDRLCGGRDVERPHRPCGAIGSALAHERARFDEGPHALLEEERIALRSLDQKPLDWIELGIATEQGAEELVRAFAGQRVDSHLGVVGLLTPGVPVLGPIVHEDEGAHGRQALDQRVEEDLRLAVDPVEVLEDH
jgi:hypothetical protein